MKSACIRFMESMELVKKTKKKVDDALFYWSGERVIEQYRKELIDAENEKKKNLKEIIDEVSK